MIFFFCRVSSAQLSPKVALGLLGNTETFSLLFYVSPKRLNSINKKIVYYVQYMYIESYT